MRKPEYNITQIVFSTIYNDVEEGIVDEIIYITPAYDMVVYGITWNDGSYTKEPEWRLSETKVKV